MGIHEALEICAPGARESHDVSVECTKQELRDSETETSGGAISAWDGRQGQDAVCTWMRQ